MTLKEYINQSDPAKSPVVILKKGEYEYIDSCEYRGVKTSYYSIPSLFKEYGIKNMYIQKGDSKLLYCSETKGHSCFRLP
ncbi:MAG: hypothetical protein RR319_01240 [Bacteroides sp.]